MLALSLRVHRCAHRIVAKPLLHRSYAAPPFVPALPGCTGRGPRRKARREGLTGAEDEGHRERRGKEMEGGGRKGNKRNVEMVVEDG